MKKLLSLVIGLSVITTMDAVHLNQMRQIYKVIGLSAVATAVVDAAWVGRGKSSLYPLMGSALALSAVRGVPSDVHTIKSGGILVGIVAGTLPGVIIGYFIKSDIEKYHDAKKLLELQNQK